MENFETSHRIGIMDYYRQGKSVFVNIRYINGELSITGEIGPNHHGNAASCGQIRDSITNFKSYAKGWDWKMVSRLKKIWKDYHLNHMVAASPNQRKWLVENPQYVFYNDVINHMPEDILHDKEHIHNGKPYEYGTAWLKIDVPQDVLEWLKQLPESDRKHPWH